MDIAGAQLLRQRIEQQAHWRQASAVVEGRQPAVDPDIAEIESIGDGIRIYTERRTAEGTLRPCKRLVNGYWELGTLEASVEPAETPAPIGGTYVSQVA